MSDTILTEPIILDETGQLMLDKLDAIISALNPNAQGVSFDKTGCEIITANNVQGALTQLDSGLDDTNASLTNYTDYIYDEVLIGKRQGFNLYRKRIDFNNIQCALNTETLLGTNVLPSNALNPTISDKSFIKMGNIDQIFSPNNMYFIVYFIGRNAYFRQAFSSSQTWNLVLFVEYALQA